MRLGPGIGMSTGLGTGIEAFTFPLPSSSSLPSSLSVSFDGKENCRLSCTNTMKPKSTSTPASALKFSLNAAKQSKFKLNSKNNYDDDDDEDDEDDYINDDELKKYSNNSIKFNPNPISFGPGKGRSAPTQRKAMGKSGASDATVHVCTNCGAEYVKWVGRCSTCKEWNTVQEFRVGRERRSSNSSTSSAGRPVFKSSRGGGSGSYNSNWNRGNDYNDDRPSSWLTGIESDFYDSNEPVRITDVYKSMGYDDESKSDKGRSNDIMSFRENRIKIPGDEEFNNVLGSGIMPGSLILLGGDPGVGKSTLLLQMAGQVASLSTPPRGIGMGMDDDNNNNNSKYGSMQRQGPVLYVSGEENSVQIASRAMRLGIDESELLLFCETDADFIAETVASYADDRGLINNGNDFDDQFEGGSGSGPEKKASTILGNRRQPSLLIIDSIQTMICDNGGSSSAGGITQVRECVGLFLRLAKSTGVSIILVGHVTKTGGVAGPRTVEHMVDTVLYLEGGASGGGPNLRMLRASKNRFGSSDEVGVYEMNGSPELGGRLIPVSDPSSLFLADRFDSEDLEGCAISIVLEGIRPMTVEVQALVTGAGGNKSFSGRRTVDGLSTPRLLLILAVLQKRCGISLSRHDVYINVVGGIRLSNSKQEGSGSDLAVAVSLASSLFNIPVRSDTAFVGEIGLLGELRQVSSIEKRINEARRMGFSRVIIPRQSDKRMSKQKRFRGSSRSINVKGIDCMEANNLMEAIQNGLVSKIPKKRSKKKGQMSKEETNSYDFLKNDDTKDNLIIDDDEDDDDEYFFQ